MAPLCAAFESAAAWGTGVARRRAQGHETTHRRRIIFQSSGNATYQTTKAPKRTKGTQIAVNFSIPL
jgi:hypothetical protein